ncbi:hypothetical protein CK203_013727 [Vitis vinifera]|uniref:Uncharacterized protein n=1 Tax=Vitis vinifera TaxID=29760 RepID=A0A438I4U7_VITVI|nr:hypothetical protein CK203_024141 [Vitis vinifera]RVX09101.1 hypothetical protein CK203_013727 [Vitis vinifera]
MLRIKLDKSEILLVGIVENIEILALELGCKGALPSTYLGLPLRAPHKSVVVWDGVEERVVRLRLEQIGQESFGDEASSCKVGDDRRVKFWKDKWCKNDALCDSFPSLYVLVASKEAWVAEC